MENILVFTAHHLGEYKMIFTNLVLKIITRVQEIK